jgi:D-alanine-D-alanine ligase
MQRNAVVLVLMGGPDAEREVSITSGREAAAALRSAGGGRFTVVEAVIGRLRGDELASLANAAGADVVFPALHGQWGEGGPLQELLEALGLPYVGSRPSAAALAMNKMATKSLLELDDVPTPRAQQLRIGDACEIDPPLVLKPVDDGSSVDMRICRTREEANRFRREVELRRPLMLAEEYVRGREITAGILFGEALPLVEIIPGEAVEFYDYEAKYTRDDTRYVIDPDLPGGVDGEIRRLALLAFERLGCRDIARVDFMVDDRGPWFLELNTMPGFTTHSLVPMAAEARGWSMPELCARLVDAALARAGDRAMRMTA